MINVGNEIGKLSNVSIGQLLSSGQAELMLFVWKYNVKVYDKDLSSLTSLFGSICEQYKAYTKEEKIPFTFADFKDCILNKRIEIKPNELGSKFKDLLDKFIEKASESIEKVNEKIEKTSEKLKP